LILFAINWDEIHGVNISLGSEIGGQRSEVRDQKPALFIPLILFAINWDEIHGVNISLGSEDRRQKTEVGDQISEL